MKKCIASALFFLFFPFLVFAQTETSTGTGFFVSDNGVVVTCAHVIEDAAKITVKINNTEYTAQVLAKNANTDLAILKINYKNSNHFKIRNFGNSSLGDKVFVLGFPLSDFLGSDIRLTDGIVSAKSGMNSDQNYFQLSAPIQLGNSGGPILNSSFEVIGVAAAKLNEMAALVSTGSLPQNVNFGVKSEHIGSLSGSNVKFGNGNIKSMNDAVNAVVQVICYETVEQSFSVRIVNKTGYTVYYIYVSPVTSDSWGSDFLGNEVLVNGQTVNVKLPSALSKVNRYDIQIVDADGDSYTKLNVLITPNSTIEFKISDLD